MMIVNITIVMFVLVFACVIFYGYGYRIGESNGNKDGYKKGLDVGQALGYDKGFEDGYKKGLDEGFEDGKRYAAIQGYNERVLKDMGILPDSEKNDEKGKL